MVGENIVVQIDQIEAMCQSDKPEQVRKGRERKAALIKATVERGEVRVRTER